MIKEETVAQFRCIGDDGSSLTVIEFQHFATIETLAGNRRQPGARRLALSTGEPVRYVDARTYEVVLTGELLRRDD